jgi:hypothetical protein
LTNIWLRCDALCCGVLCCAVSRIHSQYRLCPANSKLDEECFQKRPLKFVGQGSLRWGGVGGEQIFFNASDTSVGTVPAGSTWRKCPIPRGPWGWIYNGPAFEPVCEETAACKAMSASPGAKHICLFGAIL